MNAGRFEKEGKYERDSGEFMIFCRGGSIHIITTNQKKAR